MLLPTGMQVHVHFVDDEDARSLDRGLIAQMWIQACAAARNIGDQRKHGADTIAQHG